jgi:hypothetical protein
MKVSIESDYSENSLSARVKGEKKIRNPRRLFELFV